MFWVEALVWVSQNLWALILHLSGKPSFPKPLKAEEERQLIDRMDRGDSQARDKLIEHNLASGGAHRKKIPK